MDWTRRIYGYCERAQSAEFWAEPLNAVSNGAFILAALIALLLALRARRLDGPVAWLIAVTFVVGVGSFLFHTFATVWAAMLDTTPIGLFILSYFVIAMNRYGGFSWVVSALLSVGFLVAMGALSWVLNVMFRPMMGGSISYVPALLAMLAVGLWLHGRGHPAARWLVAAAAIFSVSVTFRALDWRLCGAFPAGTHWAWHLLNAVVLGTLVVALIRHGRKPG